MTAPVRTALVIDDDADMQELLAVLLESAGFEVDAVRDGIQAVNLPKQYDVILLDLKMPVFDGESLAEYWQLTNPEILRRVVVLSGFSHYTRGRPLPAFASLAKPSAYGQLIRTVMDCVQKNTAEGTE